jgi:vanillate monooxygenase ferredoxin subunit
LQGTARAVGWPDDRIHIERFSNAVDETGNAEFDVRIAGTGAVYRIPADRSIVEVLSDQGIEIPVSCEQAFAVPALRR